jgi:uncharacterized protein YajQ (UPF0234 family)
MTQTRSEILIEKLIKNTLTSEELDELLETLKGKEGEYTVHLKKYFESLIDKKVSQNGHPPLT